MTDTYTIPDDYEAAERQAARAATVGNIGENPDTAARAIRLAQVSGHAPEVLMPNLDQYEEEERAKWSAEIVANNKYLAQYVNSTPIAAQVSNDDYADLDETSEHIAKLNTRGFGGAFMDAVHDSGLLNATGLSLWRTPEERAWMDKNPLATLGWAVPVGVVEKTMALLTAAVNVPLYLIGEASDQLREGHIKEMQERFGEEFYPEEMRIGGVGPLGNIARKFSAGMQDPGLPASVGLPLMNPLAMTRPSRRSMGLPETEGVKPGTLPEGFVGEKAKGPKQQIPVSHNVTVDRADIAAFNEGLARSVRATEIWLAEKKDFPRYLHPTLDQLKRDLNEADLKILDEAASKAAASLTRERAKEAYAVYARIHGDAVVEVHADAVAQLYGDKVPLVEDGLLGWVPNIKQQLDTASQTGGDIQIPLSAWLSNIDKEVQSQLSEHIRVRPGHMTKAEGTVLDDLKKARLEAKESPFYHGSPASFGGFGTDYVFLTKDKGVATDYATRDIAGAQAGVKGTEEPTVYSVRTGDLNTFDMRKEEHQQLYEQARQKWNAEQTDPDAMLPPLTSEGFIQSPSGLPGFGNARTIMDLMKEQGFDSVALSESTQGTSLMVAKDKAQIANIEPVLSVNPLDNARLAAALEPFFHEVGKFKLTKALGTGGDVHERARQIEMIQEYPEGTVQSFVVLDEKGAEAMHVHLREKEDGRVIYIEDQRAAPMNLDYDINSFGPIHMRDLLRQLQAEFPMAEEVHGFRVTGARARAGSVEEINPKTGLPYGEFRYKFRDEQPDILQMKNPKGWDFSESPFFEPEGGVWQSLSERGERAYLKSPEMMTELEREITVAIYEELQTLVGEGVQIKVASRVQRKGEVDVAGMWVPSETVLPILAVSFQSPNMLKTARHEAIHHLRQMGFITPDEWAILQKASEAEGWIAKHNIPTRYPNAPAWLKMEESIAEGFGHWQDGKLKVDPATQGVFDKLKTFFDAVKRRMKQIFGRDLTWQEIFAEIESGRVGQREGNVPLRKEYWREGKAQAFDVEAAARDAGFTPDEIRRGIDPTKVKQIQEGYAYVPGQGWTKVTEDILGNAIADADRSREIWNNRREQLDEAFATEGDYPQSVNRILGSDWGMGQHPPDTPAAFEKAAYAALEYRAGIAERELARLNRVFDRGVDAELERQKGEAPIRKANFDEEPPPGDSFAMAFPPRRGFPRPTAERGAPTIREDFGGQLRMEDITRMEDRKLFERAKAMGVTEEWLRRYEKLIEDRINNDIEKMYDKSREEIRKRQTAQWREDSVRVRQEVIEDLRVRPDIDADAYFAKGILHGERQEGAPYPKLDPESLTPEQQKSIPNWYMDRRGSHPDDIASMFGFEHGADLIDALATVQAERGNQRYDDWKRKLINAETQKRMEVEFGRLEENVMAELKERLLSAEQVDLLHEEVLKLGLDAGTELSITKEQMEGWALARLMESPHRALDSDKLLAAAGKVGKAVEGHLLFNRPLEAFREKQRQFIAVTMAKEAAKIEKERRDFDKTVKRYDTRDLSKDVDLDYFNFIQELLAMAGLRTGRGLDEIRAGIDNSPYATLNDFVREKSGEGWDLQDSIAQDIRIGRVKHIDQMTNEEFLQLKAAVDQLDAVGKAERSIVVLGETLAFDTWKEGVLENIQSRPIVRADSIPMRYFWNLIDAPNVKPEDILKNLDLREKHGPLFNAVILPLAKSKFDEGNRTKVLSEKLTEMKGDRKWQKSLKDKIDQDFMFDPYYQELFTLTRADMINMMMNFGNRSNIEKFTRGWIDLTLRGEEAKIEALRLEARIWDMFERHGRKEDWDFVQKMWDLFAPWKKDSTAMYRRMNKADPKWIEASPIQTQFGQYAGGYFPVIYDQLRSGIENSRQVRHDGDLFGLNYPRATTSQGHHIQRTNHFDRVEFQGTVEQIAFRAMQMIHDVSYRESIMQASKIIHDKQINAAIRQHYGPEYANKLDQWLKDTANHFNLDEVAHKDATTILRHFRLALINSAIPASLNVLLSPDIGSLNPKMYAKYWANHSYYKALALEKSQELPHTLLNMDRDFKEKMERTIRLNAMDTAHAKITRGMFMPLMWMSQHFRIVTFLEHYLKESAKPSVTDAQAAAYADSKIRAWHGSGATQDLPSILRGSELLKTSTIFGTYLNTMHNRTREMIGNVRHREWSDLWRNFWGAFLIPTFFGAAVFHQWKLDETWGEGMAKVIGLLPVQGIPFVREFANYLFEGHTPRTPLGGTIKLTDDAVREIIRASEGRATRKPVQRAIQAAGAITGKVPGAFQMGRTGQFWFDVQTGKQNPRTFDEWMRGVQRGESQLRRR